jgi:hypothetical protein
MTKRERDAHGRWRKGTSGNPSGASKPRSLAAALQDETQRHSRSLARKLVQRALAGDMRAAQLVFGYLAGTPALPDDGKISIEQFRAMVAAAQPPEPEGTKTEAPEQEPDTLALLRRLETGGKPQ